MTINPKIFKSIPVINESDLLEISQEEEIREVLVNRLADNLTNCFISIPEISEENEIRKAFIIGFLLGIIHGLKYMEILKLEEMSYGSHENVKTD